MRALDVTVGSLVKVLAPEKFAPSRHPLSPPLRGLPGYHADLFGFLDRTCARQEKRQSLQPPGALGGATGDATPGRTSADGGSSIGGSAVTACSAYATHTHDQRRRCGGRRRGD
jgi:hypothetical protein